MWCSDCTTLPVCTTGRLYMQSSSQLKTWRAVCSAAVLHRAVSVSSACKIANLCVLGGLAAAGLGNERPQHLAALQVRRSAK